MTPNPTCAVHTALEVLGGKWKLVILHYLSSGAPRRFSELERLIGSISPRMLVKELKELEAHGILERKAFATVPPTVEYRITAYGMTLVPIVEALEAWGKMHRERSNVPV